ncbi:MAG: TldD/PmbA family protein [Nanoarchaeota archaeon]|nr:TldD/PmbA family protein [Nanoarchaeota archaeon]MBU4352015.1 TldD/PmbA family protein [Nanoarchaeota archaeon]MBU4456498.1 TldD/PmbA family protein [Nanoarchaeota archaeon]MCG2719326.1 TldD/PmbA family protein [Nanoarchaeota archaeon]
MEIRDENKLKKFSDFALNHVKDKVDYADLLIENISKIETKLLPDGQELVVPYSSKAAMQLRLIKDKKHIEVSLGMETEEKMKDSINTVLKILETGKPDEDYGLAEIPNPKKQKYGKQLKSDLREIDTSNKMSAIIAGVKELAEKISKENKVEIKPEVWFFSQIEEKIIADTQGIYKTQVLPTTFLQVFVKVKKENKMSQFRMREADIEEISLVLENDKLKPKIVEKIKDVMDKAIKLLSARELTKEELNNLTHYVLTPSTMVFVHEAQGHNFEADIIKEGGSGLLKSNGKPIVEKIASEIVDIYDAPLMENGKFNWDKGFGSQYIDDEGVEIKPVQLIKNGKIVNKLHNRETAHYYNEEPNGRGFSELGDQRVVRMTNTFITPAEDIKSQELDELLKDVKLGILLEGSLGGQVSKDGMATSLQIGYLIKDGTLTKIVLLPANMAVATRTALLTAEGFSGEVEIPDGGFCGKAGQTKFVTDGGPIVKIRVSDSINLAY